MDADLIVHSIMMIGLLLGSAVLICFAFKAKISQSWQNSNRYDVILRGFTASENGKILILQISRSRENGIISEYYPEYEDNVLFVDFDTEGGKDIVQREITLDMPPECDSVYFCRSGGKYLLVLKKDEAGQWNNVSKQYIFKERNYDI